VLGLRTEGKRGAREGGLNHGEFFEVWLCETALGFVWVLANFGLPTPRLCVMGIFLNGVVRDDGLVVFIGGGGGLTCLRRGYGRHA